MAGKKAGKRFIAGRSYKLGVASSASNALTIKWKQRPKPQIYQGSVFVEAGCEYTNDFWSRNPIDAELKTIFTIAEIDPDTNEEITFDVGSFHNKRSVEAQTLSDVPTMAVEPSRLSADSVRMWEDRVAELRKSNEVLQAELSSTRQTADQRINALMMELRKKDEEIGTLKADLRDVKTELRIMDEKVLPAYKKEAKEAQLSDSMNAKASLFAPIIDKIADRVLDRFMGGSSSTVDIPSAGTSDDLDSRIAGV